MEVRKSIIPACKAGFRHLCAGGVCYPLFFLFVEASIMRCEPVIDTEHEHFLLGQETKMGDADPAANRNH